MDTQPVYTDAEADVDALRAENERLRETVASVARARNYAMRQRDEERRAKSGNIEALNAAIVRAEAAESKLAEVSHVLSRRSAALDRVVGEKRTLEARLENVEALADEWQGAVDDRGADLLAPVKFLRRDLRAALDAPVPSWRALCPHGGCADPDSCRDAVRADNEED